MFLCSPVIPEVTVLMTELHLVSTSFTVNLQAPLEKKKKKKKWPQSDPCGSNASGPHTKKHVKAKMIKYILLNYRVSHSHN